MYSGLTCEEGSIRLVGSQVAQEGILEYCSNNSWYSLCADTWQEVEATIVCSTLGFSTNLGKAFMIKHDYMHANNLFIFV